MFDIGFSEIVVIAVVALIVIGPERLPTVSRTLGILFGKANRYVSGLKADISRELSLDEIKVMEQKVKQEVQSAEASFNQVGQDLSQQAQSIYAPPSTEFNQSPIKHHSSIQPSLVAAAKPEQYKFPID
jgi:sec-independent protein translocase protein TatB